MKTIKSKIDDMLNLFSKKVNTAILANNFKKVSEDYHNITIECLGETVEIWNVDEQTTNCFRVRVGEEGLLFPKHEFYRADECRAILREMSASEIEANNKEIDEKISQLQQQKR